MIFLSVVDGDDLIDTGCDFVGITNLEPTRNPFAGMHSSSGTDYSNPLSAPDSGGCVRSGIGHIGGIRQSVTALPSGSLLRDTAGIHLAGPSGSGTTDPAGIQRAAPSGSGLRDTAGIQLAGPSGSGLRDRSEIQLAGPSGSMLSDAAGIQLAGPPGSGGRVLTGMQRPSATGRIERALAATATCHFWKQWIQP